jgi:hypothetical protein
VLQRGQATAGMVTALMQQTGTGGSLASLKAAVGRVFAAAGTAGTTASMGDPALDTGYASTTSAVRPSWLAGASVDLDGDGTNDTTTKPFDDILSAAAKALQLCKDPTYVRSIFAVNFNAGQKDGKCRAIDRFKWVKDEPGKRMFFVGGVHKESPMQDDVIQVLLGNWSPNQIAMYDDGTHGDQVAADNVWSVTFDLPATMRIGYKYTWGKQGTGWTGSEEWPGNQRILQITDWNVDSYVYRYDNFGDEATNKDRVNLYEGAGVDISWDTDLNGDGIPEAVEQKVDPTNSCLPGSWTTPSWIGPAVVYCG